MYQFYCTKRNKLQKRIMPLHEMQVQRKRTSAMFKTPVLSATRTRIHTLILGHADA